MRIIESYESFHTLYIIARSGAPFIRLLKILLGRVGLINNNKNNSNDNNTDANDCDESGIKQYLIQTNSRERTFQVLNRKHEML